MRKHDSTLVTHACVCIFVVAMQVKQQPKKSVNLELNMYKVCTVQFSLMIELSDLVDITIS